MKSKFLYMFLGASLFGASLFYGLRNADAMEEPPPLSISTQDADCGTGDFVAMVEEAVQTPNAYFANNTPLPPNPLTNEFDHHIIEKTIIYDVNLWFCVEAKELPADGEVIIGTRGGVMDVNCFRRDHSEPPVLYRSVYWRYEIVGN